MYNLIPLFLGGMMFILGLVMIINPKSSTKKEFRNDESMIAKTKKNGFIVIACGIVILVLGVMRLF